MHWKCSSLSLLLSSPIGCRRGRNIQGSRGNRNCHRVPAETAECGLMHVCGMRAERDSPRPEGRGGDAPREGVGASGSPPPTRPSPSSRSRFLAGIVVSARQLQRWDKSDLLPRPRRRALGRGKGTQSLYPLSARAQLIELCRLRSGGVTRLDHLLFALWRTD